MCKAKVDGNKCFSQKGWKGYTWHIGTTKTVIYQTHTYFGVALRRILKIGKGQYNFAFVLHYSGNKPQHAYDGDGVPSRKLPGNDSRHFHKSAVQGEGGGEWLVGLRCCFKFLKFQQFEVILQRTITYPYIPPLEKEIIFNTAFSEDMLVPRRLFLTKFLDDDVTLCLLQ